MWNDIRFDFFSSDFLCFFNANKRKYQNICNCIGEEVMHYLTEVPIFLTMTVCVPENRPYYLELLHKKHLRNKKLMFIFVKYRLSPLCILLHDKKLFFYFFICVFSMPTALTIHISTVWLGTVLSPQAERKHAVNYCM